MARKNKTSGKKRSSRKILDAYQIAERAENRSDSNDDSADENDVQDGILDARRFLKDGQADDEFEDEELDSDEALGSDDDYDVLNSKFSQTIRDKAKKQKEKEKRRRRGELNSDDESEEEEDEVYDSIDEGQLVTLSEAWDMDEKDLKKSQKKKGTSNEVVLDDAWESESEQESEEDDDDDDDEDGEDSDSEDIFDNEDDNEDDNVDLKNTVSHLQSQLKKPAAEKRRLVTESIAENEFGVPAGSQGLSLADMMAAVDTSAQDAILIDTQNTEKSKALATPLPKRIQERHDRKVAYEISKKEVNKWQDTVKQNRDAEVLKFPMQAPSSKKSAPVSLSSKESSKVKSELEDKINSVLSASALVDEQKEATFEQIAVAKLSPAEMIKRTKELRMMRELMFREEAKAKRIKKIKSKSYHKIKKKEMLRNQELVEGEEDSDNEDHDVKRAEERMNLRHKTNSKWAKSMIKSGLSKDASNRAELEEMLRNGERLRAKQLGYEDGDQSDDNVSDIEKEYAQEQEEIDRSKLGKGVLAMDFMKNAEERRKQENLNDLQELRRLEGGENGQDEFTTEHNSVDSHLNQGRRVYAPSSVAMKESIDELNKDTLQELDDDESKNLVNKLSKKFDEEKNTVREVEQDQEENEADPEKEADAEDVSNPWLTASKEPVKKSSKVVAVDQSSSKLAKSAAKIAKSKKRSSSERDSLEEAVIDVQNAFKLADDSDDEHNEDGPTMFTQAELIKQAFAGDDVVKEFEDEKKQIIVDEDDKEEDVTLPGWGDWAGADARPKKKKKFVRTIDGVAQADKRKDKNLKNVIINEKVNKKNLKYQSSAVPFPFESREQYERSLRMPIGQEWTSRETHQKLTMPRVITKQGSVIDPLKAPFK